LLQTIIASYKKSNIMTLSLSVDKENQAFRLYQRLGFLIHADKGHSVIMKKGSGILI